MISPVIFDTDHSFKRQNALCLTKKSFIKVSMVRHSCLVIFYFDEKFCVLARVSETWVTITVEDPVEKFISPVIFDTNRSFKRQNALSLTMKCLSQFLCRAAHIKLFFTSRKSSREKFCVSAFASARSVPFCLKRSKDLVKEIGLMWPLF